MPYLMPQGIITEEPGSGRVTMTRNGIAGERKFRVPWLFPAGGLTFSNPNDPNNPYTFRTWIDFALALTGKIYIDANTGNPVRTPPDVFSNEFNYLLCQELEINGDVMVGYEGKARQGGLVDGQWVPSPPQGYPPPILGGLAQVSLFPLSPRVQYEYALISAKYAPREFNETLSMAGQSLQRPGTAYGWTGSTNNPGALPTTQMNEPVAVQFPMAEYNVEARQVLSPNFLALLQLVGKINANATCPVDANGNQLYVQYDTSGNLVPPSVPLSPFLGMAPRTLLLNGIEARRTYLPNGFVTWDMNFKFLFNQYEHVKVFRPGPNGGNYQYVKAIGTNRFPYDPVDMSIIQTYLNYV